MSQDVVENNRTSSQLGTKQANRFFEALNGDYVKIDERSFEELLVYTSRLSSLINYYGPDNKVQGDWSHFFSDETVILSSIVLSEPNRIEKKFKKYLKKVALFRQEKKKSKYFSKCCVEVYQMALDFDHWYTGLKKVESFSQSNLLIRAEIESAITVKLADSIREFKSIVQNHGIDEVNFDRFGSIWKLDEPLEAIRSDHDSVMNRVEAIFQNFYETLLYLRTKTPEYLEQSMQSDIHYPEVSLHLAFLKLYAHTQDNINALIDKHVDFYYKKILRQSKLGHRLDKTYLQIELDAGAGPTMIPAGTRFFGLDRESSEDIYYRSLENLLANKVKIAKVYSVYINKIVERETYEKALKINGIFYSDMALDKVLSPLSAKKSSHSTLALFGEDQAERGKEEKTMDNASVGFALSSPVLHLQGGDREVEVTLYFEEDSYRAMMQVLQELSHQAEQEVEEEEKLENYFVKVFSESFRLSLTTQTGWYQVGHYVVRKNPKQNSLTFLFDVNSSVSAIVSYDSVLHEGNFETHLPVIRFELNSDSFLYGYTFMSFLKLEKVQINVGVSRLKKLLLYNNIGQLSPDSPFLPFGPTPQKGAYFVVGNTEVFGKSLEGLSLNIEWFGLPQAEGGFKHHYDAYKIGVDNTSFEVSVTVLDNGTWKPETHVDQQVIKLFRSKVGGPSDDPVAEDALINETMIDDIDLKKIAQSPSNQLISEKISLSATTQRGFMKLELTNPVYGFAHDVYQSVLSEAIIENAKGGLLKSSKKIDMPMQPYAPQVKSISMNYQSSSVISLKDSAENVDEENGQIFHIHPFGSQKKYPSNKSIDNYVVPHYDFEGAAYIGLEGVNPPESVAILFEMVDEYSESSEEGIPELDWDYLVDDEWRPLSTSRILRDETSSFLKTGIVELSLPGDISNNSKVLDANKYWLRISVRKNINSVSALRTLATNALVVTLDNAEELPRNYLTKRLAKHSIDRTANHINGVRSVLQPLPSFDGRAAESQSQFYTRVGERLRHKGRAITTWDYERITLEEFPEVDHATCLSNMNSQSTNVPGSVLMVVSPVKEFSASNTEPMASTELLMKIKNKLVEFGSSFVNVEVRNPTYERIKIICAVKFTEGHNHGYYFQKLNEDINKYLRGTLLSQVKKMGLGGSIHISDILSYIRTLSYVEFVTRFSMIQVARNVQGTYVLVDTAREGKSIGALKATKPWSILVPAPEHQISVLIDHEDQRSRQAGIDYLQLGQDFIIED
ncbi:hypothetical protein BFP72_06250 [Reichenbachiella sp. 5M10]|uniref:baseplate J/gp47 family protein n=1 Tax=Reichenbachiella sp. 5M10 TaxID=1889772 RepID=UPI000C148597|nr:baseplate J/gp47 family protein [Reichenbachiella sp. 5M10]PIB35022.1 hypothetical protein BFP72_06250 [Reichenbachiella sp. 5M10]